LYEYYTNDDYNKFELVDFRTLRYKSKDNLGGEDLTDLNFDMSEEEPSINKISRVEEQDIFTDVIQ
jgi:hypothetical protein